MNPEKKSVKVGFKITPTLSNKLNECAERLHIERVAVVEQGIEMVYQTLDSPKEKDQ